MPKCLEIDDTLVLKPKDTCWLAFDWRITSWLRGAKSKLSVLMGENYETWISTKSCSVKLSKVPIGLLVVRNFENPRDGRKLRKFEPQQILLWARESYQRSSLIGLLVPKKLEKTEKNCPNKNICGCFLLIKILWLPLPSIGSLATENHQRINLSSSFVFMSRNG